MKFLKLKTNFNISIRSKLLSDRLIQKTLHLSTKLDIYTYLKGRLPQKIQCRSMKMCMEKSQQTTQVKLKTSATHTDLIKQQRR